jgi:hypothetical protein
LIGVQGWTVELVFAGIWIERVRFGWTARGLTAQWWRILK